MPIFKDFGENGELLQTRDEPLSPENFDRYQKENSIDRVQGYLDAIADITKQIDKCYIKYTVPADITGLEKYTLIPNSEIVFQRKVLLVNEQAQSVLHHGNSILEKLLVQDKPSPLKSQKAD